MKYSIKNLIRKLKLNTLHETGLAELYLGRCYNIDVFKSSIMAVNYCNSLNSQTDYFMREWYFERGRRTDTAVKLQLFAEEDNDLIVLALLYNTQHSI